MRRLLVIVGFSASALLGCQCQPPVSGITLTPLVVEPRLLSFPSTYLGTSSVQELTVTNPNQVAVRVSLAVELPFSAEDLELAAGEERAVPVSFAPSREGPHRAVLLVRDDLSGAVEVALEAQGTAWPDCGTPGPCELRAFEPERGQCVTTLAPDDSACTSSLACFTAAACRAGECVGQLTACDDADVCTLDACGAHGCVHVPRTCAVTDPCLVARCDPQLGCTNVEVEDGTPCGAESCAEALVCLAGACQRRPRPNAATDCFYREVETGRFGSGSAVCAVTLGGDLKCWGGQRRWPWIEAGWAGARALTIAFSRRLCAIFPDGGVGCSPSPRLGDTFGPPSPVPFSGPATALEPGLEATGVCALLADGSIECLRTDGGLERVVDAGPSQSFATGLPAQLCTRAHDGGLACTTTPSPSPPLRELVGLQANGIYGVDGQGTAWGVVPGRPPEVFGFDAGVVLVGGGRLGLLEFAAKTLCLSDANGLVRCTEWPQGGGAVLGSWDNALPPPLRQLTRRGVNFGSPGVLCAIDGNDEVWCLGGNSAGELGDDSVQPRRQLEVLVGQAATSLNVMGHCCTQGRFGTAGTWIGVDGGLLMFSAPGGVDFDGGYPVHFPLPRGVVPVDVTVTNFVQPVPESLRFLDANGVVWDRRGPLQSPEPMTAIRGPYAISASGRRWFLSALSATDLGPASALSGDCILYPDAGIGCGGGLALSFAARTLGAQASRGAGCAGGLTGGVTCWQSDTTDAGLVPRYVEKPGLLPFPRMVEGTIDQGCVLTGSNGVQCRGAPLGPDAGAGFVPIGEPVRSLSLLGASACALTHSGAVVCWGSNQNGLLGRVPLHVSKRFLKIPW